VNPTVPQALAVFFRDPSDQLYDGDQDLWRRINTSSTADVERLLQQPWLLEAVSRGDVISSRPDQPIAGSTESGLWLRHPRIPVVTYPWEWAFSALKSSALLTLDLEILARAHGYSLKDATGTNILFQGSRPVLVDVLSFEPLQSGTPWVALGQFCRAFLFPLMLRSYRNISPAPLLAAGLGEINLDDAWQMLGWSSLRRRGVLKWVGLQRLLEKSLAKPTATGEAAAPATRMMAIPDQQTLRLIHSLRESVTTLHWDGTGTLWADYAGNNSYRTHEQEQKVRFVDEVLQQVKPPRVFDLGANSGEYSVLASRHAAVVCSVDLDAGAVELMQRRGLPNVWAVQGNLANPTPSLGWMLQERPSLMERMGTGFFLALALIHHLRISAGIPLAKLMEFFAAFGGEGIVEWVDRGDPMVQSLLRHRKDVFDDYNRDEFMRLVNHHFRIERRLAYEGGTRELVWIKARHS